MIQVHHSQACSQRTFYPATVLLAKPYPLLIQSQQSRNGTCVNVYQKMNE